MDLSQTPFRTIAHEADLCVVGGGMAGVNAALAASRRGAKVVLMHERPVFGGNASSEIGVRICGADRNAAIPHTRETGILEEIRLTNLHRNPHGNLFLWDLVLFEKLRFAPNLVTLLNCSCLDAAMDGVRIVSVTGWQQTTQTWHTVEAGIFADCSGDAVLAPLTGAEYRMGREARAEFDESIAPETADDLTMGMSCGWFARDTGEPRQAPKIPWTRSFTDCDQLPWGESNHSYLVWSPWWCELGGEHHSIHDTEKLRDEVLKISLGVWDHLKNHCVHSERARTWDLHKISFLPGKRESRRYLGAHMLTQNDVEAEGRFADTAAFGGWTMDDHHPAGFESFGRGEPPTIHHPAPSPYGISYRCLYSRNIDNLMFAGRDASASHAAMSSTRVMGTASSMGQAVGTAAALAAKKGITPAEVDAHIGDLQQMLLADDAYVPWTRQEIPDLTRNAKLTATTGDPEPVRDGINRQMGDDPHAWVAAPGAALEYAFDGAQRIDEVMLVLDSAMESSITMESPGDHKVLPDVLPESLRLEVMNDGQWRVAARIDDNAQRLLRLRLDTEAEAVRLVLGDTRGAKETRVYACIVNPAYAT